MLKPHRVPVVNEGRLKASQVVDRANALLPAGTKLTLNKHAKCWKFFGIRPSHRALEPWVCKGEYCSYDAIHGDYSYTAEWVTFLVTELTKPDRFREVTQSSASTARTQSPPPPEDLPEVQSPGGEPP